MGGCITVIKTPLWNRGLGCHDPGTEQSGLLCYPKCPEGSHSDGASVCWPDCTPFDACAPGHVCTPPDTPLYYFDTKDIGLLCVIPDAACRYEGGNPILGVCWYPCGETFDYFTETNKKNTDVGALCRKACTGYPNQFNGKPNPAAGNGEQMSRDILGVCWGDCKTTYDATEKRYRSDVDVGALCRKACVPPTPYDLLGVCWGDCGNDIDVGALCREHCRKGFHEVLAVCWGDQGTYARKMMLPMSIKTYDPGYQPPMDANAIGFPWCDYGKPSMLDAMAQFYYDQSTVNPVELEDGRIQYEYIVKFYGLIVSSELSCDVACLIRTVTYDPVTGAKYTQQDGAFYPNDQGNLMSYRRFYFINTNTTVKSGEVDFTVTGCTHTDGTALDVAVTSTDPGVDLPMSLPKVFKTNAKNSGVSWSNMDFRAGAAAVINVGVGMATGANLVTGVAGGFIGNTLANRLINARPEEPNTGIENFIVKGPAGDVDPQGNPRYYIATNNDHFTINHGPIYEQASGYVPNIKFCSKFIMQDIVCTNPYILRDTLSSFHKSNPDTHIKQVDVIESRGRDGCYYKWKEVSYNKLSNVEGTVMVDREVVLKYKQPDMATCVFVPETFVKAEDMKKYPLKRYDDINGNVVYPTRNMTSIPTFSARYVRLRPPTSNGDGVMMFSQVLVYDSTAANIALRRPVFATSTMGGAAAKESIVDGASILKKWPQYWSSAPPGNRAADYIEIDLGAITLIHTVVVYSTYDYGASTTPERMNGVRVQLLATNGPTANVLTEMVISLSTAQQAVDFTNKVMTPKYPSKPFVVPTPAVPEAPLGGIGGRFFKPGTSGLIAWQATGSMVYNPVASCGAGVCPGMPETACSNFKVITDAEFKNMTAGPYFTCNMMNNTRCQDKAQIDILVQQYNADSTNPGKILKVLAGVTPAAASLRCDYQVELLRTEANGKKTVSKDRIAMSVKKVPGTWTFNYNGSLGPGTYIQDTTLPLSAPDTSGGIFTFKSVTKTVTDIFSNIIAPMQALDPVGLLNKTVTSSDTAANSLLTSATTLQGLEGCPNTKCSDPGVLAAMMQRYNVDNNSPSGDFGVEVNSMNRITKAGASGPNSCDVMFENLYEMYDDILYEPVSTSTSTKAYRFPLTNIGNCQFKASSGTDVSGNAFGITSDASILSPPFTQAACKVNCRDPAILRSVKQRLETRYGTSTSVPIFKNVSQSFLNGANVCEYQMAKDVASKNATSMQFTSMEYDMTTYVSATFDVNPTGCSFSIKEATEYPPESVAYKKNPTTGLLDTYVNGVLGSVPTLYDYDETRPTPKVNTETEILS
jgi:hypothetical protein